MERIYNELSGRFEFVRPEPACEKDLRVIHTKNHVDRIKRLKLYENALLAAGGALKASEFSAASKPAFGLIRPPRRHASPDHCWWFCFFDNIATSVERLRDTGDVRKALIVDIDLHYGDGTANIFKTIPQVSFFHMSDGGGPKQIQLPSSHLNNVIDCDVVAVSAGFDRHVDDWGGTLTRKHYGKIGRITKEFAEKRCGGLRYGVPEGGYNHTVLGKNMKAFLEGMR